MSRPQDKNPCPRDHEIHNFGGPFLSHHYFILSLSDLCLGVERKIIGKYINFTRITPQFFGEDFNGLRPPQDDGGQARTIGHLSESGDLKNVR